jgi:CHAT domain-containing protein/Tfp pilus assembly protein PilF
MTRPSVAVLLGFLALGGKQFPLPAAGPPGREAASPPASEIRTLLDRGRNREAIVAAQAAAAKLASTGGPALAEVLVLLGSSLSSCDRDAEAVPLLEHAIRIEQQARPRDDKALALAIMKLGRLEVRRGDYGGAKKTLGRALALLERRRLTGVDAYAQALAALGSYHLAQLQFAQAQPLLERALVMQRRLGDERQIASRLVQLASLFAQMNQRDRAQPYLDEAMALLERSAGREHPDLLAPLVFMTWKALEGQDTGPARELIDRQLAIAELACGPDNGEQVAPLMQRAHLDVRLGDPAAARADAAKAVQVEERFAGAESPRLPAWLRLEASILQQVGDAAAAENLLRKSVELASRPGLEVLASASMSTLGVLLVREGRVQEATEELQASQRLIDHAGTFDPGTLTNLLGLLDVATAQPDADLPVGAMLDRAIPLAEKLLGHDHPAVARLVMQRLPILLAQGDAWRLRPDAERAVAIIEREKGSASVDLAAPLVLLGRVEGLNGNLAAAKTAFERAVALLALHYGNTHPATAFARLSIAEVLDQKGDLSGAAALYESVTAALQAGLGPLNPNVAQSIAGSAAIAMERGQYDEAARLYDQAIGILGASPGRRERERLALLLASRAEVYLSQGRFSQTEATYQQADSALGATAADALVRARFDAGRASAISETGRFAEAEALFTRAIRTLEDRRSTDNQAFAEILLKYAHLQLLRGSRSEAIAVYERVDRLVLRLWGPGHRLAGYCRLGSGIAQEANGDLAAARASYEAALANWQQSLGPQHPQVAAALTHLGDLALHSGDFQAAESAYERSMAINTAALGPRNPGIGQALLSLSHLQVERGHYVEARSLIEQSLAIGEEAFGATSPKLAAPLNSLGRVLSELGLEKEAESAFTRARQLLEDAQLSSSAEYATVLDSLGNLLVGSEQYRLARPLLERALAIRRVAFGEQTPAVAASLHSLASLLAIEGDLAGSQRSCEAALVILARTERAEPEEVAGLQGALAALLSNQGDYVRAQQLQSASLETLRRVLGPAHPHYGAALALAANMQEQQGDVAAGISSYRTALSVTESALGQDHPQVGRILLGLGAALGCNGDRVAARAALEAAGAVLEKSLGATHPEVAEALFDLGNLRGSMGDAEAAAALLHRAVAIMKDRRGPDHPAIVKYLAALAVTESLLQQRTEALDLLRTATRLEDRSSLETGAAAAGPLCHLAWAATAVADFDSARRTYDHALEVLKRTGRAGGIEAMGILMGRAEVAIESGDAGAARSESLAALEIADRDLPASDLRRGAIVGNLGMLDWRDGQRSAGRQEILRAADILAQATAPLLSSLSLAEQRAFLGTYIAYPVPYLLSFFEDTGTFDQAYQRVLPLKGMLIESLRREHALTELQRSDRHLGPLADSLRRLRNEISGLELGATTGLAEAAKRRLRELSDEKEKLERALMSAAPRGLLADPMQGLRPRDIQRLLREDEAIVDLYRYDRLRDGGADDSYAAVILARRRGPLLIRLGPAQQIHRALRYWTDLVLASPPDAAATEAAWRTLSEVLWTPVEKALPADARRIWVSPDAELAKVPWQFLAGSSSRLIGQVDSVRELVRLRRTPPHGRSGHGVALIAGGIDFNAGGPEPAAVPYPPLPATAEEGSRIGEQAARAGLEVTLLQQARASKEEVLRRLPQADYVHLATHGIFATSSSSASSAALTVAAGSQREPWMELVGKTRNPLAESAIALAGANRPASVSGERQGLLTAEEVIGIRLWRAKMITLSACDTGRGEQSTGQGVLGLRAAFLAAGARSLVMSLWKVPDRATSQLMQRLYANLWQKRLPPLAALLEAQTSLRDDPSGEFRSPINWAGWILVGEGW